MITIDPELLEILACPACHAALRVDQAADELVCTNVQCRLAYPVREDIPVLLVDEARHPADDTVDETAADASADAPADAAAATTEAAPEPTPDAPEASDASNARAEGAEGSSSSES